MERPLPNFSKLFSLPSLACVAALGLASLFGPASVGSAQEPEIRLAPPGPCAERRLATVEVPVSPFSVVGSPANLLSPVDVAAGPTPLEADFSPPSSNSGPERGPCDSPGTGCGVAAQAFAPSNPALGSLPPRRGPGAGPVGKGNEPPIGSLAPRGAR